MDPLFSSKLKIVEDSAISTLQASKWLQVRMLLGETELLSFFKEFPNISLYRVGVILPLDQLEVQKEIFIADYLHYLEKLKIGILPNPSLFRRAFSLAMTTNPQALFAYKISETEYLVKVSAPIIQIQAHSMHYSKYDHKFRPMTFGSDCITWGLQFSYPQIYQDPLTLEICKADRNEESSNSELFKNIMRWQRVATKPTPFLTEKGLENVPIRIGKSCISWINNHPQFVDAKIKVKTE